MPQSPKLIEKKIEGVTNAWENLAKTASFGKMTLAQYKTKVQASLDAREAIKDLEARAPGGRMVVIFRFMGLNPRRACGRQIQSQTD